MENTNHQAPTLTWHTEHLWTSAETDKINAALVKFHAIGLAIPKHGVAQVGGGAKRQYMKLDDIVSAVRPALASVACFMDQHLAGDSVVTRIVHESGQFTASKLHYQTWESGGPINNLQKMGGGLTYLRRYALAAVLALPSDEDSDAEGVDNMGNRSTTGLTAPAARMTPNYAAEAPTPAKALPWLNLTDKKGALTESGTKAVQFIEGGGKLAEVLKKYRLNKTDLAKLQDIEAGVYNAMEQEHQRAATHENDEAPF